MAASCNEHLENKGLVIDIFQEAYRRAGIETKVVVVSSLTKERADYMFFSDWSFANEISFRVMGKAPEPYLSLSGVSCFGTEPVG